MSLVPDEITETVPRRLSLLQDLEYATANMRHWEAARQKQFDTVEKANKEIAHADKCLGIATSKMNETLTRLGFLNAPDAEAGA